ncbi:MAG: PadR family transcriptional regulator [Lachnospiraceae bacterium]
MMRNLKYAILGLLNQSDMTGYELMKQFESTLCEFWSAKHSQIYPELKRLNEDGDVEYKIEISGTSLEKKMYSITSKGREDFMEWLSSETKPEPTPKNIARLKIFFSNCLSPKERMQLLQDQHTMHHLRLQHLRNNQKKFKAIPANNTDEFGDYLVLLGAIMREEMNCEWLLKCIEMCK